MTDFTQRKDMTRWNRTGLTRFRYIDGNAITHLETLRQAMAAAFTDAGGTNQWDALTSAMPVADSESPEQRQTRWIEQYRDERRDYAWEILRAFARAGHVLTDYVDAYANETFLETATQWDHVRYLCEMLDYHPAPPASAQTSLALIAKGGSAGTVAKGFAVKNKPQDGSAPVVFETLHDLGIDARLNQLRALAWNQSQAIFSYMPAATYYGGQPIPPEYLEPTTHLARFPYQGELDDVSVGTRGVLVIETDNDTQVGISVQVASVGEDELVIRGDTPLSSWPTTIHRHQVRLLLKPSYRQSPRLNGSAVAIIDAPGGVGLASGALVAWLDSSSWRASRVDAIESNRIQFKDSVPGIGKKLYTLIQSRPQYLESEASPQSRAVLPTVRKTQDVWSTSASKLSSSNVLHQNVDGGDGVLYDYVDGSAFPSGVYYLPDTDAALATVTHSASGAIEFDGDAGDLTSGDWVIAMQGTTVANACRLNRIDEEDAGYSVEFDSSELLVQSVYANFEFDIRPTDHDVNDSPVFVTDKASRSNAYSKIFLEADTYPELLDVGRTLVVAGIDDTREVTVKDLDRSASWIKIAPALPGSKLIGSGTTSSYTAHGTIIYANVVTTGHGESGKLQVLGSGNATQTSQRFELALENVAFVTDPNMSAGVAAAIEVSVDGQTWKQVETLHNSEPEEPHYTTRITEQRTLHINFGDGWRGRRLPTGQNNVRALARVGTGLRGNLNARSLVKIVKPHYLIEDVVQLLLASGGNDMEGVESMREFAPASVLSLSRAVSLDDFTHLVTSNASVWQARAYRRLPGPGRSEKIEIAVVPAGGGELGTLEDSLRAFVKASALPGVDIAIRRFEPVLINLAVSVQVKEEEFDPDLVAADVGQALLNAFALSQSRLGESLFLSRVFEVVERVPGVANSHCAIGDGGFIDDTGATVAVRNTGTGATGSIKRVSLFDWQAMHIDPVHSVVNVTTLPYTL